MKKNKEIIYPNNIKGKEQNINQITKINFNITKRHQKLRTSKRKKFPSKS